MSRWRDERRTQSKDNLHAARLLDAAHMYDCEKASLQQAESLLLEQALSWQRILS